MSLKTGILIAFCPPLLVQVEGPNLSCLLDPKPIGGLDTGSEKLVDLNKASEKELKDLKGVGPATAKKIIEGRPYKSVADLSKAGIFAKTLEALKPFVTAGPATVATRGQTCSGVRK